MKITCSNNYGLKYGETFTLKEEGKALTLEQQLKEAKSLVFYLESQIDYAPLAEAGDMFQHDSGDIYMIAKVEPNRYNLICVEGGCKGESYGHQSYDRAEDCFDGFEDFFTKIS